MTLFGRGNGDLFVTFRWTTPSDGPMPVPEARLAVLADALEDAGASGDILEHLRDPGPHVRGCHVVDALVGKG